MKTLSTFLQKRLILVNHIVLWYNSSNKAEVPFDSEAQINAVGIGRVCLTC